MVSNAIATRKDVVVRDTQQSIISGKDVIVERAIRYLVSRR
jgi:hypothetical protein